MRENNDALLNHIKDIFSELKQSNTITGFAPDMITLHTLEGKILNVSPASLPLFGYEPDGLAEGYLCDLCHPQDRLKLQDAFQMQDKQTVKRVSYRFRRKEGNYIWVETTVKKVDQSAGAELEGFVCISRDITKCIYEIDYLKEEMERYRSLVEQFQETLGICQNGKWVYLNDAGLQLFGGVRKSEITGQSVFNYVHEDNVPLFKEKLAALEEKNNSLEPFELKLMRHDGEIRQVQMACSPTKFQGEPAAQVVIRDITREKETEEVLQHTKKLSVVGQLAAGIAHEIRNPLTSIKGFTQLIQPYFTEESRKKYVDIMLTELNRIESIINDLLVLAKPQVSKIERTDMKELIEQTIHLLNSEAVLQNVEIFSLFDPELEAVECESDKIKQVLINVLKNAIEASEEQGKIFVKVCMKKDKLRIQIADEGKGISEKRLEKLGEPFYSTKEKGTGLGLMICKKIIEAHHGNIDISSRLNEGTTVEIVLPIEQTETNQ
ncbi:MAG TPA: PAS domain S-box protein [Bacillales bacterium]|nr:PAS domain S-box protein [Bacillales bacterium]